MMIKIEKKIKTKIKALAENAMPVDEDATKIMEGQCTAHYA